MPRPKPAILTKNCAVCDSEFRVPDTKRERKKATCSKSCASKFAYSHTMVDSSCTVCDSSIVISKSVVEAGLPRYCADCSTHRYVVNCEQCGEAFRSKKSTNMFCSTKCHKEFLHSNMKKVVCAHCGKEFERVTNGVFSGKRGFCSVRCRNARYTLEHPSRYGGSWSKWLRRIKKRDGHKCMKCGGLDRLQVHHFVKLRLFADPNDAHYWDNLVLLCNKCHVELEDSGILSFSEFLRRYSPTRRESDGGRQK